MDRLGRIFVRGLVTILPIAITIYILYSAVVIVDGFLGAFLRLIVPSYIPGLGLFSILLLIFVFGLMLNNLLVGRFLNFAERQMLEVPLFRAVYSPLKDLMNLFSKKDQKGLHHVVMVKVGEQGHLILGLVTRENFTELKIDKLTQGKIAVYIPYSYGFGGFTLLVPENQVIKVDIPIEKAMSLALTGWVKSENKAEGTSL